MFYKRHIKLMMKYESRGLMCEIRDVLRLTGIIMFGSWNEKYKQPRFLECAAQEDEYQRLLQMVDAGQINEAENLLLERCTGYGLDLDQEDFSGKNMDLEMALCVYGYINDKEDSFLRQHGYERFEIQDGIQTIFALYGIKNEII